MAEPGSHVADSGEWYESQPIEARHGVFLRLITDLLLNDAVFEGTKPQNGAGGCPVLRWCDPENLAARLAEHRPSADGRPATQEQLLAFVRFVVDYSVKTGHPHFFNQLFSSLDPYGLAGQWLTDALNPSVYTYEVAPVFTLMETEILLSMRKLVYGDNHPSAINGDGIFCPGGSMANGCAINLARFKFAPEVKANGLHGMPRLVLFTSEDAHYSVYKMAALQGLGEDGVIVVKTDSEGRMDVGHLETQIEWAIGKGYAPFMVSATAGTTVLGAFDPLPEISRVCEKYGLWMHVDAAWGGGLLFSRSHRGLLAGIERADSITWNPHKLLAVPQQCSTLLLKHKGILSACHSRSASYLFQKDKFYDTSYDIGDKYLQCGRRVDALKFWMMWKAKGTIGLERHVDKIMDNIKYFVQQLQKRKSFKLVLEKPAFANICFWFVPPRLQGTENSPDYWSQIHKVAPKIKERMMKKGSLMVNYQPLRDWPNFFRFVLQSSGTNQKDMDFVLNEIEQLGKDL
ncbi:cysteine sulfinic acid decarboxylase-like [Ischnura elegans]|uniref:cysteine sulfinic acid decarboxylase-like n=1 Tax=Ischnura elegans TaxID=197161 RepID=UPI001ED89376|nr:cysteine sulfinic acid decarboxylase-like [Ischnura elegans]